MRTFLELVYFFKQRPYTTTQRHFNAQHDEQLSPQNENTLAKKIFHSHHLEYGNTSTRSTTHTHTTSSQHISTIDGRTEIMTLRLNTRRRWTSTLFTRKQLHDLPRYHLISPSLHTQGRESFPNQVNRDAEKKWWKIEVGKQMEEIMLSAEMLLRFHSSLCHENLLEIRHLNIGNRIELFS